MLLSLAESWFKKGGSVEMWVHFLFFLVFLGFSFGKVMCPLY